MATWSGCSIKDSIVVVVVDNGDHVIAAVLKLRLCVYTYAHTEHARHVHVKPRGELGQLGTGEAKRRLTSISIKTAHTRSRDREHARRDGEKGSEGGERIESRGEAICLPNEMSPRPCALRCGQ